MTTRELNIYRDLVSSSAPRPRRRSKAELRHMSAFDRLCVEVFETEPMTEAEQWDQLRREDQDEQYRSGDWIMPSDPAYNDGPPGWAEDEDD